MLEDKVDSPADRKSRTSSKVTVKYGILFLIVSGVFAYYGYLIGGWGWLLWWPALSFSTVACGYLGLGAKIFGKRTDGTIAWHVFPYLLRSRHLCIPAHRPQQKHPRVRATDRKSEGTTPGKEEVDRVGNSGRGQCRSNCRAGALVLRRRRS